MSDYIKREDAIQAIENTWINGTSLCNADKAKRKIVNAPSADVAEVRHGHWINDIGYAGWTCSECDDHEGNKTDKYCHNCGAKMDEEQEREQETEEKSV